jgi:hypothetical protein
MTSLNMQIFTVKIDIPYATNTMNMKQFNTHF